MPKEDHKTTFIVTTASAHGAWYPEKKAALSLINSHVANRKARQINQRRGRSEAGSRSTKSSSEAGILPSLLDSTHDTLVPKHAEASETSDREPDLNLSWTFEELNDIFGPQGPSARLQTATPVIPDEPHSQRISPPVLQPGTTTSQPRDNRHAGNKNPVPANRWERSSQTRWLDVKTDNSVPERPSEGSVSRLPYRVAGLTPGGRYTENASPSTPGTRPSTASQLQYDSAIFAHIETLLDPRVQIAGKVTMYEQRLLHFCNILPVP